MNLFNIVQSLLKIAIGSLPVFPLLGRVLPIIMTVFIASMSMDCSRDDDSDDDPITDGHGMTVDATSGAFQGLNSSGTKVTAPATGYTNSGTLCFEVHMDECPSHILVNWTENNCENISGASMANDDSENEGLINDESLSDQKRYMGLIVTNATITSLRWFASERFVHGL